MPEIQISNHAERDLRQLDVLAFHKIVAEIKSLADNPRPQGCRKLAGSKSDWRIRIGDYRVLYEIDDRGNLIRILRVRHRREAYR